MGVGGRADHAGAGPQGGDALDMVVVVMGQQYVGQLPAARVKHGPDRRCFGRIDKGGLSRARFMQQKGVVVRPAGNGDEFKGHGIVAFAC